MHPKYTSPDAIKTTCFQWSRRMLTTSPAWGSVTLRDGNLALSVPMNPRQKLESLKMLCDIGVFGA